MLVKQLQLHNSFARAANINSLLFISTFLGMSMTDARRKVRVTIENTINALQGGDNKVNPLGNQILNKLADVTLTKCEQPPTATTQILTQIRKRPVIAKQRDWPEKKIIKDEILAVGSQIIPTEVAKIEEKNPEMLAKKIIAQGRSLEKSKVDHHRTSSGSSATAATLLSPRKQEVITPQPQRSSGTVEVEVRRIEQQQQQNRVVDLPRVDLTSTLNNVQNQQQRIGNIIGNSLAGLSNNGERPGEFIFFQLIKALGFILVLNVQKKESGSCTMSS